MRNLVFAAVLSLATVSTITTPTAVAGTGHSHAPVAKEAVTEMAKKKRDQLVKSGKIDKSWGAAAVAAVEQKTFKKAPEWVVTFRNETVTDETKRTLYLFYAFDGHYLASNFTGK